MGVDTIIWIIVWFVIALFLFTNLLSIVYFIGVIFWLLSSVFDVFQYIGTSCSMILNVKATFYTAIVFFIGFQFYKMFLHR